MNHPKEGIIFTRYLYLKDEVEVVLLISLLNKRENALFWAYELYYSGFEEELFTYLFQIYYDFYYVLNPGFQEYFIKKYKEWQKYKNSESENKDIIVSLIVQNLLSRQHNTDIYTLRTSENENENENENKHFKEILETCDLTTITQFVLNLTTEMEIMTTLEIAVDYFKPKYSQPIHLHKVIDLFVKAKHYYIQNIQLLAWIVHQFSKIRGLLMGKNIYVSVEPYDILVYETIESNKDTKIKSHNILPVACMYSIAEDDLSAFPGLERNKISFEELQKKYWHHWLYYASFSPIWFKRIEKYGGKIDSEKETVLFINGDGDSDEDSEEEFYQHFGYEPDEQKREIQEKNIGLIGWQLNNNI